MNIFNILIAFSILLTPLSTPVAAESIKKSTLRTERIHPQATITPTPTVHEESSDNLSLIHQFLAIRNRILTTDAPPSGYIISTLNEQQSISQNDLILLHYSQPLPDETTLDIFRPGPTLYDPISNELLGHMLFRLGSVQTTQTTPHGIQAIVTSSLQAIESGDRLEEPHPINTQFTLHTDPQNPISGHIVHIQNNLTEAAANMIVAVSIGRRNRAVQGLTLPIYQATQMVTDPVTGQSMPAPQKSIGQAILFQIGEKVSFAMLTNTQKPIHLGDKIGTP